MPPPIFLDHHATTPLDPRVFEAMLPYLTERFGNPASVHHGFGRDAARAVDEARAQVAELLGASPAEIVFTSGATESNNLALKGLARGKKRGHIVTTAIEHASVLEACRALTREGYGLSSVGVGDDGIVQTQDVEAALRDDTILVAVMAANNEIGTLQPMSAIGALCRSRGVALHCDAAQAAGRMVVDVREWGVTTLSLSAHKLYGPKGVGALFVRRRERSSGAAGPRVEPLLHGGGQERGLRAGTLNTPGIVGLGAACRLARAALASGEPAAIAALRDRLLQGLEARLGAVAINGSRSHRLPGNLNVSIAGVAAEPLLVSVGERVALSIGSACAEAAGKGSHVLAALGLPPERIHTALRFGLGRYNTPAEVDAAVDVLASAAAAQRVRVAGARVAALAAATNPRDVDPSGGN